MSESRTPTTTLSTKGSSMDLSLISAAVTSVNAAKELGKAAIGLRDFNQMAAIVSQLNDQILKVQDNLFTLQGELFREQQEKFEAAQKIREMQKALEDRDELELVDIGQGFSAYQRKAAAVTEPESAPVATSGPHYFCQACFDGKGVRSTLQPEFYMGSRSGFKCRVCHERFLVVPRAHRTSAITDNKGP